MLEECDQLIKNNVEYTGRFPEEGKFLDKTLKSIRKGLEIEFKNNLPDAKVKN